MVQFCYHQAANFGPAPRTLQTHVPITLCLEAVKTPLNFTKQGDNAVQFAGLKHSDTKGINESKHSTV